MTKKKRRIYSPGSGPSVKPEYYGVSDIRLEFSDNFVVQHDPDGFYLTFFQVEYPMALTREDMAKVKAVRLQCVSRVFVTPHGLDAIINALIENRDTFRSKFTIEEVDIEDPTDHGSGEDASSEVQASQDKATSEAE